MTLAHLGLGLFVLGACVETSFKHEAAQALSPGGRMTLGAYELALERIEPVDRPTHAADRAIVTVTRAGRPVCTATPERRFYPERAQTTSEVAICERGLDDLYIVLGEPREQPGGGSQWVLRAYDNPWARLIFFGPAIMALGGLVSLADRRLRFAAPRRALRPAGLEAATR